jgi:hypothetical protein
MSDRDQTESVIAIDRNAQQFGGLPIFLRPDGLKAVRWLGS